MYDFVVIGSGPAGLGAALYVRRFGKTVVVIEKEYRGTGQIAWSRQVDNYLGMPGICGFDLGEAFRRHAEQFGAVFEEGEVVALHQGDDKGSWLVQTGDGKQVEAKAVICATGASHRPLTLAGGEAVSDTKVSYCAVCDGELYRGKVAAVIGGGDTALGDAMYLSELCEKVYLIHRRNEFRGSQATVKQLRTKKNVEFLLQASVSQIREQHDRRTLILDTGKECTVDGIFVAVGMKPQTDYLKGILSLDAHGYVPADETGRTEKKGIYVAGDLRAKALRQVVTAVADGANAATAAMEEFR